MKRWFFRVFELLIIGLISVSPSIPGSSVEAMTLGVDITPTTFIDEDNDIAPCSLREAIESAIYDEDRGGCTHTGTWSNDAYDNDEIILSHGTYELTLGKLALSGYLMPASERTQSMSPAAGGNDIIFTGASNGSTIDGNSIDRVFQLATITISMENLLITGGYAHDGAPGGGISTYNSSLTMSTCGIFDNRATFDVTGGGIANGGDLTLDEVLIMGNFTEPNPGATNDGNGGGLYNEGDVTATDVYITGNSTGNNLGTGKSGNGGGIANNVDGTMLLNRLTVANNFTGDAAANAAGNGGGIYNLGEITMYTSTVSGNFSGSALSGNHYGGSGAGIHNDNTMTISHSTIADNHCGEGSGTGGCVGGGIQAFGSVSVLNTIFADNTAVHGSDCIGTLISNDYLLMESTGYCTITGTIDHNIYGQDPLLGELVDLGGVGWVHPLRLGSPAIDTGPNTCLSHDQRHLQRPKDGNGDGSITCDIGAYEAYLWAFAPLIQKP